MIIYDIRCDRGHTFEGWFQDLRSFEKQRDGRLIDCPVCGENKVEILPASVAVVGRGERSGEKEAAPKELSPRKAVQMLHEFLDRHFDDVGPRFAEIALKIHQGEEEQRNIKGITTDTEEQTLREEGVQFIKIPLPKFDS